MKQFLFLALGLTAITVPSIAQHNYQKSAFTGYEQLGIANNEKAMQTRTASRANFPGWKLDVDKLTGNFSDMYGDAMAVSGSTSVQKSQYLMANKLKNLGINKAEWQVVRDEAAPNKAYYVDYKQNINGHEVTFSRLSFRFTDDGAIARIRNRSFGSTTASAAPELTKQDVMQSHNIYGDLSNVTISNVDVANDWAWFPAPAKNGYTLQPAWEFTATGTDENRMPVVLNGFIDAVTGELLYRSNEVDETLDVTVKGNVYTQNTITPATLMPLPNLEIAIGSTNYNADSVGYFTNAANSANLTFKLKGKWSTAVPYKSSTPTFTTPVSGPGNIYVFPDTGASNSRLVNAYYHVNTVHAFLKMRMPTYTGMDFSLTTNVDNNTSTCNAFYTGQSGNSINFYAAGGGCSSFAEIPDVVYHEYGHGISRTFYNSKGANSMRNGALNEGCSDVWAMSITKDSVLGRNSMGGPLTFIRRYDVNYKVYPADITGEVHADGEIIAGCWWDVARNLDSYDEMSKIFVKTYNDVPDGPAGMEGMIYHDVLISAILNDDNDATLSNGTPHFDAIVRAFAKHGIYLYADATLNHQELAHQPANTPITVNASLAITNSDFFQNLKLFYRNRTVGTWDTVVMTDQGGFNFTGQIPAQPLGSIIDYYFSIYDYLTIPTVTFPNTYSPDPTLTSEVTIPYQFAVGVSERMHVDFETDNDWALSATTDKATTGKWVQEVPKGTFYTPSGNFGSFITQVDKDHTTGNGQCLVTGNGTTSYSANDVDNGAVTATTPLFDLGGFVNPVIEYYRWYSNDRTGPSSESNRRNDLWRVDIRTSTNTALWTPVENTRQSDYNWRRRVFALDQYYPGQRAIQLRFVATDAGSQGIVEAAVDDFFIYDGVPTSVNDVTPAKANVYPNPADKTVIVDMKNAVKGNIGIYDLAGREVKAAQLDGSSTKCTIDTKNLTPGQYMLIIHGDNKTIQSSKIVVTHQ